MRRWLVPVVTLVLLLALAQPALAQGGAGGGIIFGEDYTLASGQQLSGDLVVFGGNVVVEEGASVRGSVVAFGGTVRIAGLVDGDVVAVGGRVDLQQTATVTGKVTSTGGTIGDSRARVDGGIVGGSERVLPPEPRSPAVPLSGSGPDWAAPWRWAFNGFTRLMTWLVQTVFAILTMVVIAAVVVSLSPGLTGTAGEALTGYPAESIAAGLLAGLGSAVALVILTITCIGLPVALVLALALALSLLLGWIVAGMVVGERVLQGLNQPARPVFAAVVGVFLLTLLARLPGLGFLVVLLVGAWGLGAVALTRFGTTRFSGSLSRSQATTPPEPPQPAS